MEQGTCAPAAASTGPTFPRSLGWNCEFSLGVQSPGCRTRAGGLEWLVCRGSWVGVWK